ncbi:MAG: Hsp70 family protein [Pseudomonadota bacterium]
MLQTTCGLDFGTSNSSIAVPAKGSGTEPTLLAIDGDSSVVPSAMFFDNTDQTVIYGAAAHQRYLDGEPGRYLRGLKRVLGTSLADDGTFALGRYWSFTEILESFIHEVKHRAEALCQAELQDIVIGRPVHFVEGDPAADQAAEDMLHNIAVNAGFRQVAFQFEPVAAALSVDAQQLDQFTLVVDLGGGTSDFSVLHNPPGADQLEVLGVAGVTFGGQDADRALSLATVMHDLGYRTSLRNAKRELPTDHYHRLATWHQIDSLYNTADYESIKQLRSVAAYPDRLDLLLRILEQKKGHALAGAVERNKIRLCEAQRSQFTFALDDQQLQRPLTYAEFAASISAGLSRIDDGLRSCLKDAEVAGRDINSIVYTGGTALIPSVRTAVKEICPAATIVPADVYGAVAMGLSLHAARLYG